jgi:hypothetical protein
VTRLGEAFNYGNDRVYDLMKEVPNINVHKKLNEALTSYDIAISFGATGGQMRIPFAPEAQSVTLCSGEWNQVGVKQLEFALKRPHRTSGEERVAQREHPYGVFDFPPNVSGKPFGLVCHIKS